MPSKSRIRKRQTWTKDLTLVSLADMKKYLLEEQNDRDEVISSLLLSATAYVQASLGYVIDTTGEIVQYFDEFSNKMFLWHRYALGTGVKVEWTADGASWTEVDSSVYRIDPVNMPPYIFLRSGQSWPDGRAEEQNSVRVTFLANTSHSAWDDFRQAIREHVAGRYEQPEGSWQSATMMNGITRTLEIHKMPS